MHIFSREDTDEVATAEVTTASAGAWMTDPRHRVELSHSACLRGAQIEQEALRLNALP